MEIYLFYVSYINEKTHKLSVSLSMFRIIRVSICPSIFFDNVFCIHGYRDAWAYPRCLRVKEGLYTERLASLIARPTQRQTTIRATESLKFPVSLMQMSLNCGRTPADTSTCKHHTKRPKVGGLDPVNYCYLAFVLILYFLSNLPILVCLFLTVDKE